MKRTLYDKLWDAHCVKTYEDGNALLYIDRLLLHEVTSAQAFEGLELSGRTLWRPDSSFAVPDHQVPTTNRAKGMLGIDDVIARAQVEKLEENCDRWGVRQFRIGDQEQGIVHVVGPEQGLSLPGMTLACGDSHTSTHGALAVLAQGIGTSELEHAFATQCLRQKKALNLRVTVNGKLGPGVTAKDMALAIIGRLGMAGGTGYAIEYTGEAVKALDMEARFTLCNMSIECGARTGLIAFDSVTKAWVKGRRYAPTGDAWLRAVDAWSELRSDMGAAFDKFLEISAEEIAPQITWGTKPEQVVSANGSVPSLDTAADAAQRDEWQRVFDYMGVRSGQKMQDLELDQVFIGSCTNARIGDLREAAHVVRGKRVSSRIKRALVVPGSGPIKRQAEEEGLDRIFTEAGFEWRDPGCSMCNAMNPDQLGPEERCASTSNRNFEGRQGYKGRTHLVSPVMAAAAAIAGHFVDSRDLDG